MNSVIHSCFIKIKTHRHAIIVSLLIIATIFRILLSLNIPIEINFAPHDDGLLFDYAQNIREGHWLGAYHELTLVKGISFSSFLALCNFLLIPYNLGLILLYIVAIVLMCIALKPKVKKKYLYVLYLLLLFSPFMFALPISQRLYRNGLLLAGTLLLFASYIALFLRRGAPLKKQILWVILACISLIFFWHLKEDAIWAIPFIGALTIFTILYWLIKDRTKIFKKIILILTPFVALLGFNAIYRTINYHVYGVNIVNDRSEGNFANMIKEVISISDDTNQDTRIWVSKAMLNKAFNASPTFAKLQKSLEASTDWTDTNGEVRGDWIIWKIRSVMAKENYYETASKASEFCEAVTNELRQAYNDGVIEKDNKIHISSLMRGLASDDFGQMLSSQFDWFIKLSQYYGINTSNSPGTADLNQVAKVQDFTKSYAVLPNKTTSNKAVTYATHITNFYKTFSNIINILSIASLIFMLGYVVYQMFHKNFADLDITLIVIGIGLSVVLVLCEVSIFVASFYPDDVVGHPLDIFYSAPILPLVQLFKYLPIIFVIQKISNRRLAKQPVTEIKPSNNAALTSTTTSQETILEQINATTSELRDLAIQTKRNSDEIVFATYFNDSIKHSPWLDISLSLSSGAIGYNFAYILYRTLNDIKPKKILELGLGQSTKIINEYTKHFKKIEHHIVEHDPEWVKFFEKGARLSKGTTFHILDNYKKQYNGTKLNAYKNFAKDFDGKQFDLIVIDGPVGVGQEYSRMDVLDIIPQCLPRQFVILLDDCERIGEQRTIQLLEKKLTKAGIKFCSGYQYKGTTDVYICTSEDLEFLCHI